MIIEHWLELEQRVNSEGTRGAQSFDSIAGLKGYLEWDASAEAHYRDALIQPPPQVTSSLTVESCYNLS